MGEMGLSLADKFAFIDRLYRTVDTTPDRIPFQDWYWVRTGRYRGFRARSVIGAVFMPMVHPDLR